MLAKRTPRVNAHHDQAASGSKRLANLRDDVRRAFREFLSVPTIMIVIFLLMAASSTILDRQTPTRLEPVRNFLREYVFADTRSTSDLLATIAGSLIAITAFSFGLLLLAVQQTAASMTSHVVDQFLRRRLNQFYFGFFVGLALFALTILSTVRTGYNPIYGASLALLLTSVALCLLLLLLYTTINQIRPEVVIDALHDHILSARKEQLPLIEKTRRASSLSGGLSEQVYSEQHGFVVHIDPTLLAGALSNLRGEAEIAVCVSVGEFVAFGDQIAEVHVQTLQDLDEVRRAILKSIRLERQRDLHRDPAFGIEQLLTIAWTSVSTSKSNPAPGLQTIRALRDILSRWACDGRASEDGSSRNDQLVLLPVVYIDDVIDELLDALETLAVVSTESMQHQNYAEVVRAVTILFDRLPAPLQMRMEDLVMRILSGLGDHVLTSDLDAVLADLVDTLRSAERFETATSVHAAQEALRKSVGKLNSRATRVPSRG